MDTMVEHEIAGLAGLHQLYLVLLHQLYLVLRATMLQHHMPALAVKLRLLERSAYATPAYATPASATPAHATRTDMPPHLLPRN